MVVGEDIVGELEFAVAVEWLEDVWVIVYLVEVSVLDVDVVDGGIMERKVMREERLELLFAVD